MSNHTDTDFSLNATDLATMSIDALLSAFGMAPAVVTISDDDARASAASKLQQTLTTSTVAARRR